MSICYWAVNGFGIKVNEEMFDGEKILSSDLYTDPEDLASLREDFSITGDIFDALAGGDFYFHEFIEHISRGSYVGLGDTANADEGMFLMYFSKNPWDMNEYEKSLTQSDIIYEIHKVLSPYVKDKYTRDWVKDNIGDISTGGVG